jgi:hypothetical protein
MALNYMQGLGADYMMDGLGRKKKDKPKKKKKGKNRVAKIALAPARSAFLLAIQANALKLATKLVEAYKKDRNKVETLWAKFGGQPDKLKSAIEKGSKQKLSGLGALAPALASAVPVIIKFLQMFKELGIIKPSEESEFNADIDTLKNELEVNPNIQKDDVDLPSDETGRTSQVAKIVPSGEEGQVDETIQQVWYKRPIVIVGGIAVVGGLIWAMTRKKK